MTQAAARLSRGTPTAEIHSGSSMSRSTSVPLLAPRRWNRPRKISGRPSRLTSEPVTIIDTPHHSDHWFTICAREIGTSAPDGPTRGTMSLA